MWFRNKQNALDPLLATLTAVVLQGLLSIILYKPLVPPSCLYLVAIRYSLDSYMMRLFLDGERVADLYRNLEHVSPLHRCRPSSVFVSRRFSAPAEFLRDANPPDSERYWVGLQLLTISLHIPISDLHVVCKW